MLVGASLFLFSLVKVTRIVPAIDASFVVKQGETHGPYDEGTGYHTNILGKSVLKGQVSVEGEGIYFTGEGYNIDGLKNIFIDNHYNFVIDPADDLYTFTFDNTEGTSESLVNFLLKEEYTAILAFQSPVMLALGLVGIFLLLPTGLIMFIIGYHKPNTKHY